MDRLSPQWLNFPQIQFVAMALALVAVAVGLPVTPDETARIESAQRLLATGEFDFFWPPLTVFIIAVNPFFDGSALSVRLFNLALALPVFFELARLNKLLWQSLLLMALIPYLALAVSTASQQGLMIAAMGWLILRPGAAWWVKVLLTGLVYAVNPALMLVIPSVLALLALTRRVPVSDFWASVAAYGLVVPWVVLAWYQIGEVLPTLSTNGPLNLFLGNNPDPMSHRGVGDLQMVWAQYGAAGEPSYGAAVFEYLRRDPGAFAWNLLIKAVLFFAPFDHLRSGMGGGIEPVVFAYVGLCQGALYAAVVWRIRAEGITRSMAMALVMLVLGWALYTAFFVKIRFRIPFDFLLLAAVMIPSRKKEGDNM